MRITKLLQLLVVFSFVFACTKDTFDEQKVEETQSKMALDQFDNSYMGIYKGLFSTNDGLTRGSIIVSLLPSNGGTAQITLNSGEIIELQSSKFELDNEKKVNNLQFSSAGLNSTEANLEFSVESNGANPVISNVSYDKKESNILIAKNLSRAPLTTITGTYIRTSGTGGFPTSGRTWNVMTIGAGDNQNFAIQIYYGGRIYNTPSTGTQSGCTVDGSYETCDITGSTRILGYDLNWSGTHTYSVGSATNEVCSSVSGTWEAPAYGGSAGTFVSDSNCNGPLVNNDTCANAIALTCGEAATGSTVNATNSDTPNSCADNLFGGVGSASGPGVWYSYSTETAAIVTIDASMSQNSFDTQLRVFSGSCGALVCVGSDDDGGTGLRSLITFQASANENYLIFLGGYNNSVGNYVLDVTCENVPPPTVFSLTPGCGTTLVDNGGDSDYGNNRNDVYTIDAGAGNVVLLPFTVFNLQNTRDFMRIYDGQTTGATEITEVNGRTIYTNANNANRRGFTGNGNGANSLKNQTVISSGRYLTVVFRSNANNVKPGFYAIVDCAAARLANSYSRTADGFSDSTKAKSLKTSGERVLEDVEIAKYKAVSHD